VLRLWWITSFPFLLAGSPTTHRKRFGQDSTVKFRQYMISLFEEDKSEAALTLA